MAAGPNGDWRLRELERRLALIEAVKPDVLLERLNRNDRRVDTLVKLAIGILVSFIGAGISFVFVILAQLGN